jgi:hypothetical protein
MKGLKLDVQKYTLGHLLKQFEPLAVPLFQRPYSWDKEQWIQLWEDLTANLDGEYLIGGVVLCGTERDEHQIIDGQQRLTTLTILSAAFRDVAHSLNHSSATETLLAFQNDLIARKDLSSANAKPYLKLGELDQEWFRQRIQLRPDEPSFNPPSAPVKHRIASSVRLQWKCYLYFRGQIEQAISGMSPKQALEHFARYHGLIEKNLWFVVTHVPDDSTAFTLFEVLNDRGLDLTVADLIKNVVLAEGQRHSAFGSAKDSWAVVTDALDYSVVSGFLRAQWMSESGEKITEKALFGALKEKLRKSNKPTFLSLLSRWAKEAQFYAEITGAAPASEDETLARELRQLRNFGFKIVHSVLLAVWATTGEGENKKRASAVRLLRTFLVRYSVFAGQATNTLESELARLAGQIRKKGELEISWLRSKLIGLSPSDEVVWAGFDNMEPSPHVARLILTEIEEFLSGDEKWVRGAEAVHVEHIFPQKPDEPWVAAFGANGEEDLYRARLGNLTLLAGTKNKSASNKPYNEKAKFYKESEIAITNVLPGKYKSWNVKAVRDRQQFLAQQAQRIWALE